MIPPSGIHDATCSFLCKDVRTTCEHRCTVCAAKKRCPFCHAPPDHPCMTVLYEEHVEHGNGKKHTHFHAGRVKQS